MTKHAAVQFPCEQCPTDPAVARLLGLYDQRQEGLLMQRVKVHRGRLTPAQLAALADLADRFSSGHPLHATTRQDVELHGLRPGDVPAVQRGIAEAGLTTVGACGDTLRNVTACPGAGLCQGTRDVAALADALRAAVEGVPWIHDLPRKFKISVSGCPRACGRPFVNDLGFVAEADGSLRVIGAGSLGARPGAGIELCRRLDPSDAVPLTLAALRLFRAEGDRSNRSRARLRHVRERLGDDAFRRRLDEMFRAERTRTGGSPEPPPTVEDGRPQAARLHLPLGDLGPTAALDVARTAAAAGAEIRIGLEHDILLFCRAPVRLSPSLRLLLKGPGIVTCPGATWCKRGVADSRSAAEGIRAATDDGADLTIAINGCPNNCAHAPVADIGLIGRKRTIDGVPTECFRLLAGGGRGTTPRLAEELHPAVPAARVPVAVARLTDAHTRHARPDEPFSAFLARKGDHLRAGIEASIQEPLSLPSPRRKVGTGTN